MSLKDRKLIVTGGPTREWLDPVRFISNPSTGKMGVAIADEGLRRCREVVFIHGPIDSTLYEGKAYRSVAVDSTDEMLRAVLSELTDDSVLVMAAAPADYTAMERSKEKIKKEGEEILLALRKTPDILKKVAERRKEGGLDNLFVAGFAVETTNVEEYALKKLREKNLDMICLNDVSREGAGFGTETNIIVIYSRKEEPVRLPILPKNDVAVKILDRIESQMK
jgi:phosphopantothenoylcysteine decarboxylase/phosphopantothenate--cysteine ligase